MGFNSAFKGLINVTHPSNATYISDTENLILVVFDGYSLVFYNGITHVKSGMEQQRLHKKVYSS